MGRMDGFNSRLLFLEAIGVMVNNCGASRMEDFASLSQEPTSYFYRILKLRCFLGVVIHKYV